MADDRRQGNPRPALGAQFAAWLREGAKDLQNAVLKAFPDSMTLTNEPGAPGSPTPQQVTRALDQTGTFRNHLDGYVNRATAEREPDKNQGMER